MRSLLLLLSSFVISSPLYAQTFIPVHKLQDLTSAEMEKLDTLESLALLPAGEWRSHSVPVAHGEAVELNDATWPVVTTGQRAPREAVWYRREIVVPETLHGYDLTGKQIWFQIRAEANGPIPEIVYFNGKRVALGDDLEPIVLFPVAEPGQKVLVAVKLLHTVDEKTFRGATLRVRANPDAEGATVRPSVDDLRTQIIAAVNLLPNLPTPRRDLLPTVKKALATVDVHALETADQPAFDQSLRRAQAILGTLHDALAQIKIDMAGNSHIDAAWLWPRSETIDVVKRTFTTALQLMDEYPDYTFSQSTAQYTAWIADKYPDLNAQIRQRVQQGRWEIVGGMWVEPDLNLPDGESLVRQLLIGQRCFEKEYGVMAKIGWNPDSFGYNWQLPQIYKRSGMDYFVTQKMHWNDTNQLPFALFWWESPDGSKVLTYFPTDYVHDNVDPVRTSGDFAEAAQRNPGTTESLDLYGLGDHGGGPTREILDQANHWIKTARAKDSAVPTMGYSTVQHFFDDVQTKLNPATPVWNYEKIATGWTPPPTGPEGSLGIPTWNDELYLEYTRGVYTTQAEHKKHLRQSSEQTLDAEKWAAMAWLHGRPYPGKDLTDNWKKITFNQFHDLAAGSGVAVIYRDASKDYTEVAKSNRGISENSWQALAAGINTRVRAGVPVLVRNTMAWPRTETVTMKVQLPEDAKSVRVLDSMNRPLLSQVVQSDPATHQFDLLVRIADVPPLGYTVVHAEAGPPVDKVPTDLRGTQSASGFVLENSHLRLSISRTTGCITSLVSDGKEFLAPHACGNQLQAFSDKPKNFDAWNIDPGTFDTVIPINVVDSVKFIRQGPLQEVVRISRTWQKSTIVQDISLDAGADQIKVDNSVDWHETHVLLKAAFPLAAAGPKATFEIPYGSIERPATRNNSFERARFEVPALRWADLGDATQGFSLLNDSKYGYDALGNTLRLTLLRSSTWPDPDADQGIQHFEYALYPHAGSWKSALTVRHGYELNDTIQAIQTFAHTGEMPATLSWGSVENSNVILSAVKKAEDADALVYRMYEWAGTASDVKLHVAPGARYAVESNLMEKVDQARLNLSGDVITLPIKPHEILTVQVFYSTTSKLSTESE